MLGAIAGDIIGSVHEFTGTKSVEFDLFIPGSRFTDDTVLAVAVADCLMNGLNYVDAFHLSGSLDVIRPAMSSMKPVRAPCRPR